MPCLELTGLKVWLRVWYWTGSKLEVEVLAFSTSCGVFLVKIFPRFFRSESPDIFWESTRKFLVDTSVFVVNVLSFTIHLKLEADCFSASGAIVGILDILVINNTNTFYFIYSALFKITLFLVDSPP